MKFEDIKTKAAQDAKVNQHDLDDEALESSKMHQKWLDILTDEIIVLRRCEDELKKTYRARWIYYSGKADRDVYDKEGNFNLNLAKGDLTMFIESDDIYIEVKSKVDLQREKVAYIESFMKNINNRHWHIRNAIEWRKFTQCQT